VKRNLLKNLATLAIAGVLAAAPAWADSFKRTHEGETYKDFTLSTLEGEAKALSENLGSEGTILAFFATWNSRSEEVLSDIQKLHEKYGAKGLSVIGVNVEHAEWSPEEEPLIRKAISDAGVTFPVLVDKDFTVYNDYGVIAVPSIALIDGSGKILRLTTGYSSTGKYEFKDSVESVMGVEKKPVVAETKGYHPDTMALRNGKMAERFFDKRMYARAEKYALKAIEIDENYVDPYRLLAKIYKEAGMNDDAMAASKAADDIERALKANEQGIEKQPAEKPDDKNDGGGTSTKPEKIEKPHA